MASALFNEFVIENNAIFSTVLTYYQSNGTTPVNLTGFTARMDIRTIEPDTTLIISLTTSAPGPYIVLGGSAGTIALSLPYSVTSTLPAGTYEYDLILISGLTHDRLINGTIAIVDGVTV